MSQEVYLDMTIWRGIKHIDIERFWTKVSKRTHEECWNWTAGINRDGYGKFWWNNREIGAHRFSWIITNGNIPEGKLVLHKCNNPGCVNPSHLYIGDGSDNMIDKSHSGYKHKQLAQRCVSASDISTIKKLFFQGIKQDGIATRLGISQATVSNIIRGKHGTGSVW